jgi:hypothetical protein
MASLRLFCIRAIYIHLCLLEVYGTADPSTVSYPKAAIAPVLPSPAHCADSPHPARVFPKDLPNRDRG